MAQAVGSYPLIGFSTGTYSGVTQTQSVSPLNATLSQYATDITQRTARKTALQTEASRYNDVAGALQSLNTLSRQMLVDNAFAAPMANSSNTAVLTAQAGPSAPAATYTIAVNALATAQQNLSNTYTSADSQGALGSGTLSLTYGASAAVNLAVGATTSLSSLAGAINAQVAGVTASVVQNGSGYQLMVQGQDTGTNHAIVFGEGGSINLNLAGHQGVAASDAQLTLNGAAATSNSNTVNNLLQNVSINLVSASSTAVTLSVATSPAAVTQNIADVVVAYNAVASALSAATAQSGVLDGYNGSTAADLRLLQKQLDQVTNGQISTASQTFTGLAQLGITRAADGSLALDGTTLATALTYDSASVVNLFDGAAGVLTGLKKISDAFGNVATGALSTAVAAMGQDLQDANKQIDSSSYNFLLTQQALRTQYIAFQATMGTLNKQNMLLGGAGAPPLFTTPLYDAPKVGSNAPNSAANQFAALYASVLDLESS